jgi:hypothetical protein
MKEAVLLVGPITISVLECNIKSYSFACNYIQKHTSSHAPSTLFPSHLLKEQVFEMVPGRPDNQIGRLSFLSILFMIFLLQSLMN